MDILDKLANVLRSETIVQLYDGEGWACAGCNRGGDSAATIKHQPDCDVAEALAEYERVRARTVVLTFEKAVPIACGGFAILDARQGAPSLNVFCAGGVDPEEREYAFCPLPKLPGPEVFAKETP